MFRLFAEALQCSQFSGFGGGLKFVQGLQIEFVKEDADLLGAHAGYSQHVNHTSRNLLFQLNQLRVLTGGDQFFDLLRQVFANAFELRQIRSFFDQRRERFGSRRHFPSRAAVRADSEGVCFLDFQ